MKKLKLSSYAKINLGLWVINKRKDGYHNIFSIIQAIDLADQIQLEKIPAGIILKSDSPKVPRNARNLAFKAAKIFLAGTKVKSGVKIFIRKKIPIEAGLGGGSSNAAFVLKGLNRLFGTKISTRKLSKWSEKIGSDVPFFFSSGTAFVRGRGEKVKSVALPLDYWIILVKPPFSVSSRWAYSNFKFDLTKTTVLRNFSSQRNPNNFGEMLNLCKNDLETTVSKKFPIIKQIKKQMLKHGAMLSAMSGSGPVVFGIFKDKLQAREVMKKFKKRQYAVFIARPVNWPR
ncbi:MAG: hypothetical protein RBG1_1C00001G0638 [candidate division Zixibacteria bacterium RBG-1]|nr:MAG: hypothetical protein RBG1_1C00001G0638 [candidate division Zixibacteria bacterium RBG-1]OGC85874.1 MAG: 4-(cytidine 5'-diphospho)-2-C-methyl-D-erythritol kinase [candidate division Zixibacteria bacterium RBG_19FT_COMBO_42_43]